jgi:uncharacterized protein (DUF427 family)
MALWMGRHWSSVFGELRVHPVAKWLRAGVDGTVVVDSRSARIVWEPRRVVASYAVPTGDVAAELVPYDGPAAEEDPHQLGDLPPVLDPTTPFTAHSAPGRALTLRVDGRELPGAAFEPDDPDLAGYLVLDWDAFDSWWEEDEEVLGHPHDPFDRIDCLQSSRHVVVSLDGVVLADSSRPVLLFETPLPVR